MKRAPRIWESLTVGSKVVQQRVFWVWCSIDHLRKQWECRGWEEGWRHERGEKQSKETLGRGESRQQRVKPTDPRDNGGQINRHEDKKTRRQGVQGGLTKVVLHPYTHTPERVAAEHYQLRGNWEIQPRS